MPPAPSAPSDGELIRRTIREVEPVADQAVGHLYAVLFTENPGLRSLFPVAMDLQRDRLLRSLLAACRLADDPPALERMLAPMGRGHRRFGTLDAHYPLLGRALFAALARYAVGTWTPQTEAAWGRAYAAVAGIMIRAARESELTGEPPWWQAEVIGHRMCSPDIAVITLRPDHPYPYRPGQFATLETPWWPRVWRNYSIACAPRADGTLELQVKAVSGGWVSRALVHRARPGDVIRLGAPEGAMVVDPDSEDNVLCMAGGTGIAPLKAIVEDLVNRQPRRRVELFYGAQYADRLYELEPLTELASRCAWLSLRPVVANPPARGLQGRLPDVVRRYGPFPDTDVVLSGPPEMLRRSRAMLLGQGVPEERIIHDPLEAMGEAFSG
ncbi:flavohemoprotein [Mangrovactinospora gilvigrisea]|uniref:nitric oxide dioxygenase n=1 Tax=Mangrovactinospora gilvigrisea TaxID=1428644 RepID=A0A1J7BIK0_9ACTN|nr:flavohemoprotein [Mangrovactinospora gilvigrisea]